MFNNKFNFLKFVKENNLDLLQKNTFFANNIGKLKDFFNDKKIGEKIYFVKASIGASGTGTWRIETKKDYDKMLYDIKNRGFVETIFDNNGKILENLSFDYEAEKWVNTKKKGFSFIIQEELNTPNLEEYSMNFYFEKNKAYPITQTINITDNLGVHKGNKSIKLEGWIINKITPLVDNIAKNYSGTGGIDFFVDKLKQEIYILEFNPRDTGATIPAIFSYKIGKILDKEYSWETEDYDGQDLGFNGTNFNIPLIVFGYRIKSILKINFKD